MNRRQLIKGIGAALCAGAIPPFLPGLVPGNYRDMWGSMRAVPYRLSGRGIASILSLQNEINKLNHDVIENIKAHGEIKLISGENDG